MVYHYLPLHEVKALYPKALITCTPSYQNQQRRRRSTRPIYSRHTISTHYMINKATSQRRMANFGKGSHGFSFAVVRTIRSC